MGAISREQETNDDQSQYQTATHRKPYNWFSREFNCWSFWKFVQIRHCLAKKREFYLWRNSIFAGSQTGNLASTKSSWRRQDDSTIQKIQPIQFILSPNGAAFFTSIGRISICFRGISCNAKIPPKYSSWFFWYFLRWAYFPFFRKTPDSFLLGLVYSTFC